MPRDLPALLFAMIFPTLCTWVDFNLLAGSAWMPATFVAGKVVQFGFPIAWVRWIAREPAAGAGDAPGRPRAKGLWIGLGLGVVIAAAIGFTYAALLRGGAAFADAPARVREKLVDLHCATPARFLVLAAFISVLHSGLEEYYWRWFVFGRLRRRLRFGPAAAVSALAFMSHHIVVLNAYVHPGCFWTATIPLALGVAVGGVLWAWLYERTGSLAGPWASHVLADVALMAVGWELAWG